LSAGNTSSLHWLFVIPYQPRSLGREFVAAGGLIGYSGNFIDAYHATGVYGRVLKGEEPHNLPVQHGTKVELFVNRKSAKTLGLKIPDTLNVHADELIE